MGASTGVRIDEIAQLDALLATVAPAENGPAPAPWSAVSSLSCDVLYTWDGGAWGPVEESWVPDPERLVHELGLGVDTVGPEHEGRGGASALLGVALGALPVLLMLTVLLLGAHRG